MEGVLEMRNWAELLPDALGLIFSNLSLQETLTVVPRVCKSWNQAVLGPYCWQNINIVEWSYRSNPDHIERMLRILVARSGGALREISVSGIHNDLIFSFLADHAKSLQTLQIPRCNISDSIVEQVAVKLSAVTFMDLSYCCKIGARALSAIGRNCKALVELRRNMHPIDLKERRPQAEEAAAIAAAMPKLKHLELAYNCIDTMSVVEIISSCHELELLDVRGCWDVKLDKDWLEKRAPTVKILGPHIVDQFEGHDWESCSDYSDSDSLFGYESLDDDVWDDDDDDRFGGSLELRFFEEFEASYGNGWPPSP